MECFIQYLDDLEDFFYGLALAWERIRRMCGTIFFAGSALALPALTLHLVLTQPPLAVAVSSLLLVGLLYLGAVSPSRGPRLATSAPTPLENPAVSPIV